ncbi:uncharacterized protein LOC100824963 isoform X2 [Brachypodium distachyon]|uniref:RNA polymerase III subunit C4 n=1 Tax=Brachypodium distachyon TaxID=15368 RepID=I1GQ83_BRADI|nr:uncharacterized protein LOC100824963 isoform X2 [Brachypodium distachyon]KQK14119.1 hypothetical protein BRADI_1g14420v3 [Brachypodium distachyon]KQK14125.1 hypothetical protein BRADI_1g14420v3 [Brachypodium distachyon]|eukprot:XP_003562265.1 uncharacterized protein LOC100824963 isoform X2 [Brachypodium distachyon]
MDDKTEKGKGTDGSASRTRNTRKGGLKFTPKVRTKKVSEIIPKMEPQEETDVQTIDKILMSKLKTEKIPDSLKSATAEEKEASVQVTFGQVNPSIPRSFRTPRISSSVKNEKDVHLLSKFMLSEVTASAAKLPKQPAEPQDFTHPSYNYPPITLPLRRPYFGDILYEDEFGEFSSSRARDGELTAAKELGLMDTEDMMNKPQLLFFQFPASLPLQTQVESVGANMDTSEDAEAEVTKSTVNYKKTRLQSTQGCKLKDLPDGLMGKVLVYKSGKVKMRLGGALFDVSAGINCAFPQEAVVINTNKKRCCSLGEVSKRAVVTPDIDYLLDHIKLGEE